MKHIHFIGIGGTGLSAIAKVLLEEGYKVSGSDLTMSTLTDAVQEAGGNVFLGHQAENIQGADIVVRSSAVLEENVEVKAALAANIPVLKRSEFLGRLMEGKEVIAVAGSHGKTTTTSMITWILSALDKDPSFIVGGVVANLNTNAKAGKGSDFVIEADEYDYMFLGLNPSLAVVTNVEHDHPDIFPTEEIFRDAFRSFVNKLKPDGILVLCGEDPGAMQLQAELKPAQQLVVYGFQAPNRDYIALNLENNENGGISFEVSAGTDTQKEPVQIALKIPGKHNVLNALAAYAVAEKIGLSGAKIGRALSEFEGSERRFDIRGEYRGIMLIDDYAHHPTEIEATLSAARDSYPDRRIWAVWQPHTYSRTQTLFSGFTEVFSQADQVIVLDVYAAREEKPADFSIIELVNEIDHPNVHFIPENEKAYEFLLKELQTGDLLLIFTAGDAIDINVQLERSLSA
ncbi:MAG: UDP-N-acetylmuramate--L-alanine ligase [Anaerolineales bacterium]|nr:UDP-N-acetylmuramate--L-alanine ligase [Anaerolineales bacterium]